MLLIYSSLGAKDIQRSVLCTQKIIFNEIDYSTKTQEIFSERLSERFNIGIEIVVVAY